MKRCDVSTCYDRSWSRMSLKIKSLNVIASIWRFIADSNCFKETIYMYGKCTVGAFKLLRNTSCGNLTSPPVYNAT